MQSDVSHDGVVPDGLLGGKILEFIMMAKNTSMIMPTPGSHCAESSNEVSTSTQNTSKVSETEDLVEVFRRIVENPKVLSPNSPTSLIDNYNELFG